MAFLEIYVAKLIVIYIYIYKCGLVVIYKQNKASSHKISTDFSFSNTLGLFIKSYDTKLCLFVSDKKGMFCSLYVILTTFQNELGPNRHFRQFFIAIKENIRLYSRV